jgi:hypothetical protein
MLLRAEPEKIKGRINAPHGIIQASAPATVAVV